MKTVRQKRIDMTKLRLSAEEGFVLSRVDGTTSVKELVALTGLDEQRVEDIVGRLSSEGVVEVELAPEPVPSSSRTFPKPASSRMPVAAPAPTTSATLRIPTTNSAASSTTSHVFDNSPDIDAELRAFLTTDTEANAAPSHEATDEAADALGEPTSETSCPEADDLPPASSPILPPTESDQALDDAEKDVVAEEQRNERAYRQIYAEVYAPMVRDARIKAAQEVTGSDLMALCLDADPQIIHAVLTNPHAGLDHARMIAFHHRTHVGLEAVAKRSDYLKDALVQRRMLRNPQLPSTILGRMVNPKLLMDVYKIAIDREIPERSRVMTREILRKKFMLSSADEKASLLFKTEGRCLVLLVNCSLDAHATQILCSKQSYTILFIQNLARWSATPPQVLAHLLKMQIVRRNTGLRKMILKHPNMPSELKRNFQP